MKKIKLTQGKYAIIDNEDFDLVSEYKWCAVNIKGCWYATRRPNKKNPHRRMHRFILSAKDNQEIDHINRNGLDNRRLNIKICTRSENCSNRSNWGTSKFKGVSFSKRDKRWQAYIGNRPNRKWLGLFDTEQEAVKAIGRSV